MQKYLIGATFTSCLMVSNLMAIDYNEALELLKNKSFKVIHAPYGFDCATATFDENGVATNSTTGGTITLESDGTLEDGQGFNWTIIDNDTNGFILSRTDGGESSASGIMINTSISENLVDMQTMLPFYRENRDTTFNIDGTITNYWNSEDSFTIENGAIEIISQYGGKYHLQIAYEIAGYYIMKWQMLSESEYDSYAALNQTGYTSWYNYLTDSNGKINQYDTEGLYDTINMMKMGSIDCQGDICELLNAPMIIDQNDTRLYVKSCDPLMGETREETYILQDNHIYSTYSDTSYFAWKKPVEYVDTNTTTQDDDNITTPPIAASFDIFYPNGWTLSGVGKDENLSVSNIKCENGNLKTIWKYQNNDWGLYVPTNYDYGYTKFDTINNREGFWVNCQ